MKPPKTVGSEPLRPKAMPPPSPDLDFRWGRTSEMYWTWAMQMQSKAFFSKGSWSKFQGGPINLFHFNSNHLLTSPNCPPSYSTKEPSCWFFGQCFLAPCVLSFFSRVQSKNAAIRNEIAKFAPSPNSTSRFQSICLTRQSETGRFLGERYTVYPISEPRRMIPHFLDLRLFECFL